jgi:hypothetical protein
MKSGDINALRIGRAQFVTQGRLLRITQVPESHEDYVDVEEPERIISALKDSGVRTDVFSFWQRLPETRPKFDYYMEWDNVAAIEVSTFDEWMAKQVHSSVRTNLRKSTKIGVRVELVEFTDDLVKGMSRIFNEAPIRQGRPYSHYGRSLDDVRAEWSVDLDISAFIGAYYKDELIGFTKLSYTDRYAEMSGTICMLAHRDKSAMTALIARSVQFCEKEGIPYLTYGKYTYGGKGDDSLSKFKHYNGFRKVQLPRYYVPLSARGRLGLKLGLHHPWSEILPSAVHRTLMDVRTRYYQYRLSAG